MNLFEKFKGFLLEPSKTFEVSKDDTLMEALKYYIGIGLTSSALLVIFLPIYFPEITMDINFKIGVTLAFLMLSIILLVWVFIWGILLWIAAKPVGGKTGITQSIKTLMYAHTPILLVWWIPLLVIIVFADSARQTGKPFMSFIPFIIMPVWVFAWIWSIILEGIGLYRLQGISIPKTVIVLLPLIIGVLLAVVAVVAVFLFSLMAMSSGPPD